MNDPTTISAGEAFLRRFHQERPGGTPTALWDGRGPDGRSGYRWLADEVADRARVLDLACGDGALLTLLPSHGVGVDMSHAELTRAARRPELAGTVLAQGRAQQLPFPANSFDACVSHMAFMLMDRIEDVALELARVLTPGGLLALVLGGGPGPDDAYGLFGDRLRALPDRLRPPRVGDRRTRTVEGLDAILTPAGFAPVTLRTVPLDLSGDLDHVWTVLSSVYDMLVLDTATVDTLRADFEADVAAITEPDGRIPCSMRLNLVSTELS